MALDQGPLTDRLTNWDTVFAIRYDSVNAGIKAAKSSLPTFEYKIGDESEFYSMRGDFDDWGLCPRGGGHLVRMQLPITKLVYDKVKWDTQVFSDGWVEISISLKTIMRKGATEEAGDLLDIVVNTDEGEANDIISVKDLKLTPAPSKEDERWIKELFRSWLAEHLAQFRHIFCTININAKVKGEKLKWLQPSAASYAVIDDQETIESGIFGVLCMTENRPTPEDQILDPKVIPEGFPSAFLISKERFLRKLLLEQLGYLFTGPVSKDANKVWPDDYFDLASNDTIITNNAPIKIDKVLIGKDDPKEYTCTLDEKSFSVEIKAGVFTVRMDTLNHNYYKHFGEWWLRVEHTISNDFRISLDPDTQIIDLHPMADPKHPDKPKVGTHRVEIFKTDEAKEIDLILTIAGIVLAFAGFKIAGARGWLTVAEGVPVEAEEEALLITEMEAEGMPEAEQIDEVAAEAAEDAEGMLNGEAADLGGLPSRGMVMLRSIMINLMAFGPVLFRHIVEALASKKKMDIPKYSEFAAGALAPITWPAASADYRLHDVGFDDCFQTLGDWQIKETNPVIRRE